MQEIECNTCGETTYLVERGEKQVRDLPGDKETPLKHMKRTGHDPRQPPKQERRACQECGNVWWYQGNSDRPTCPNCRSKNTTVEEVEA